MASVKLSIVLIGLMYFNSVICLTRNESYVQTNNLDVSTEFNQSHFYQSYSSRSKMVCLNQCNLIADCKTVVYYNTANSINCFLYLFKANLTTADVIASEHSNIYIKKPSETPNLINNPYALEGFNYWCFASVVGSPNFFNLNTTNIQTLWNSYIANRVKTNTATGTTYYWNIDGFIFNSSIQNFVTSYVFSGKFQIIDLYSYSDKFASGKPDIVINEDYAVRNDAGGRYDISVTLVNSQFQVVAKYTFTQTLPQWSPDNWRKTQYTFTNYSTYVRYVVFYHGGRDAVTWGGYYGTKFTGSSIIAVFT